MTFIEWFIADTESYDPSIRDNLLWVVKFSPDEERNRIARDLPAWEEMYVERENTPFVRGSINPQQIIDAIEVRYAKELATLKQ